MVAPEGTDSHGSGQAGVGARDPSPRRSWPLTMQFVVHGASGKEETGISGLKQVNSEP